MLHTLVNFVHYVSNNCPDDKRRDRVIKDFWESDRPVLTYAIGEWFSRVQIAPNSRMCIKQSQICEISNVLLSYMLTT